MGLPQPIKSDILHNTPSGYWLAIDQDGSLAAFSPKEKKQNPIKVDFLSGRYANRLHHHDGLKEPLAKAVGLHGNSSLNVIDATAGFGRDAMLLALLGCKVIMIERSPMMAALLQDGLKRAQTDPIFASLIPEKIHCIEGDAIELIPNLLLTQPVDVIYLDPMFPERTKTAAVKKEMQFLHALLGHESVDTTELVELAYATYVSRIVVKRPSAAKPLASNLVHHSVPAGQMRFDVYLK